MRRRPCSWAHRGKCKGVSHLRPLLIGPALCERHLAHRRVLRAVLKREGVELPEGSPEWFAAGLLRMKGTLL